MSLELASQHRAQVEEFRRRHRTGLLTLLFTDIVGSTKIKQALGDSAGVALIQQHHAALRETLNRFTDAQVIDIAGDSFFILFVRPSDAVLFALRWQGQMRALAKENLHPVLDRIGIHINGRSRSLFRNTSALLDDLNRTRQPKWDSNNSRF